MTKKHSIYIQIKKYSIFVIFAIILVYGVTRVPISTKVQNKNLIISSTSTSSESISFFPLEVTQGEPLMIQVNATTTSVRKITFGGRLLRIFTYNNKPTAFIGIDLKKKPGKYEVIVELSEGTLIKSSVKVKEREKVEAPFSIPEKLGGNTKQSQNELVTTLGEENKTFEKIETAQNIFWTSKFIPPLEEVVVSDAFGYSRKTGDYTIAHKGVDYKAKEGTRVLAVNNGVVRLVRDYRNYGRVIVIDHGLGVMSFYLHLSEIKVTEGQSVKSGEVIGLSGQTGYAEGPHLHFSIRIYGVSIDPVKFLSLFQ